jgi:hypothetical protein
MSREKLSDFLNKIGKAENKIDYTIDPQVGPVPIDGDVPYFARGDDLGVDPNTGLPLIGEGSSLTGDYVSYITQQSKNLHSFNEGNKLNNTYKLGDNLTLSDNSSVKDPFLSPSQDIQNYSNSGLIAGNQDLIEIVDKIGANPGQNSELLRGIDGGEISRSGRIVSLRQPNSIVEEKVQEMLTANNRFDGSTSDEVFKDNNYNINDFNSSDKKPGTYTSQNIMGEYKKVVVEKSVFSNEKLQDLGKSILLSAGGWDNIGGSIDPNSFTVTKDNLPTITAGMEVDYDNIKVRNAFNAPKDNSGNSTREGKNAPYAELPKVSQTVYNQAFNFGNVDSKIARIMCVNTIITIFELFSELIDNIAKVANTDRIKDKNNYSGHGPHVLGSYRVSNDSKIDFIVKNLLVYTDYKYEDALKAGIKVCFGIKYKNGKIVTDLKTAITDNNNQLAELRMFWTNVAFTVLRRSQNIIDKIANDLNSETIITDFLDIINMYRGSSILGLMNSLASIGNITLKQTGGSQNIKDLKNTYGPYDVDAIKDSPGTRVFKSRKRNGFSLVENSLSERSTTSMYLLPPNILKGAMDMGNLVSGQNPAKGMLGSSLIAKTFVDYKDNNTANKIPNNVVKELEDRLEAEYVPFYIQDLRTNEILHFHAFLSKLTDQINPTFSDSKSFGRLDAVKTYTSTKRTVSFGMTIVATSKEDFDEMWFKINKLTTLAYPQWSKGASITDSQGRSFTQPFSQVIAGSPIVRVRIGDVIKSNYSKFNLARLFGLGDSDTEFKPKDAEPVISTPDWISETAEKAYYTLYGSPLAKGNIVTEFVKSLGSAADGSVSSIMSKFLVNGYANPIAVAAIINQLTDPDVGDVDTSVDTPSVTALGNAFNGVLANKLINGYTRLSFQKLKPSSSRGYLIDGKIVHTEKAYDIIILDKKKSRKGNVSQLGTDSSLKLNSVVGSKKPYNFSETRTKYKVRIVDLGSPISGVELFNKELEIYHNDIIPNYGGIFNLLATPILSAVDLQQAGQSLAKLAAIEAGTALGLGDDDVTNMLNSGNKLLPHASRFMNGSNQEGDTEDAPDKSNNIIVKSFENNMGRGLAGTLSGFTFDWLAFPWELDYNSRAPMGVKVDLSLDVIHDIPPGLDHSGYNRAPLYNVGNIMKHVSGDPNGRQRSGEFSFKAGGTATNRKIGKKGE